ncbi:MAG: DsbA family protein [Gemmatimonadales bacterium]
MSFAHRVSRLKHSKPVASIVLALCASIALVAAVHAQGGPPLPLDARAQGSKTAPVTVYEMADFQCPFCRDFATETLPLIEKEYIKTGKVRWVFINLPIPSIHPNAVPAAEFAACAARQGKFWPTHNMLYATHDKWENLKNALPFFQAQMPALGLKPELMTTCLQSGAGADVVKDDVAGAERSGAHSTPTFYIEGGIMSGAQPIEVFRRILDSIYAAKTGKR